MALRVLLSGWNGKAWKRLLSDAVGGAWEALSRQRRAGCPPENEVYYYFLSFM